MDAQAFWDVLDNMSDETVENSINGIAAFKLKNNNKALFPKTGDSHTKACEATFRKRFQIGIVRQPEL